MSNNVTTLTAKELSIAERKAGVAVSVLEDPNALGKVDLLMALAWVYQMRTEPVSYDDIENSTLEEIMEILGLNGEDEDDE